MGTVNGGFREGRGVGLFFFFSSGFSSAVPGGAVRSLNNNIRVLWSKNKHQ